MKSNRKNLAVVISIIIIAMIVYFATYHGKRNSSDDSKQNEHSIIDSAKDSNPDITPARMGTKPEKNPEDGSIKIVEDFIKLNAKNPDTFQFLEWSELSIEEGYWKVRCKYRGISSFNAEVTTNAWFYIKNNKVVYTKIISKI